MTLRLMGKKRGMTRRYDEKGNLIPCTVIEVSENIIVQLIREEKCGYNALQLGHDPIIVRDPRTIQNRLSRPLIGVFKKAGVPPHRHLFEMHVDSVENYAVGDTIGVSAFKDIPYIDVTGTSKGKGYQGTMKRYNFRGGPAAHGSGFHRHSGSTGMRSTPGRCFPGRKMAGRMGGERTTVLSLKVIEVNLEHNAVIVEGAVPGHNNASVWISPAVKRPIAASR